jgi:thiamine-phosphate pyrophosphorylase
MSPPPPLPRGLYAVCDDSVRPDLPLLEQARLLLAGGVRVAQIRCKRLTGRVGWEAVRAAVAELRAGGVLALVNDRLDWTLLAGADGVHLGDGDLGPEEARALLGPGAVVGVTVRNAEGAQRAKTAGASYVGLGPVFTTRTKEVAAPPLGLEGLRREVAGSPLPVVAIGGLTEASLPAVAASGAHAAAVISDLWSARDVSARARALQAAFHLGETGQS